MKTPGRYSSATLAAAGATITLAQSFHPVMLWLHHVGNNAAWLAMLSGGMLAILGFLPVVYVLARYPGKNLIDLAILAAGRPGGILLAVMVVGIAVFHAGFLLRQTAEMAVSSLYPHTPQTFAVAALAICALYCAWGEVDGVVRFARFFLPFLLLSILVTVVGGIAWGEWSYLFPVLGPGLGPILAGSPQISVILTPLMWVVFLGANHVADTKRLPLSGLIALGVSTLVIALSKMLFIMIYPMPLDTLIPYPIHKVSRFILLGRMLERLEGFWVFFWFVGTALHLALLTNIAARAYVQAIGARSHRPALLPIMAMMLGTSLFPPDQVLAFHIHEVGATWSGLIIGFVFPILTVLLVLLRGKGGRSRAAT